MQFIGSFKLHYNLNITHDEINPNDPLLKNKSPAARDANYFLIHSPGTNYNRHETADIESVEG